jgi:hypothetical protein|tara:strand:- start:49 stop:639 length:591 start_codon:yes stop_codon:yes gene_type:complete
MRKFIIRGVSKKFKGVQKLKPQKTPSRFSAMVSKDKADASTRKVLGDLPEFMGLSQRATGELAAEGLALKTMNKKFFGTLRKELGRSRSKTATGLRTIRQSKKVPKLAVTKAKSKGALKSYKVANVKSENVFRKTMEKFTTKTKASPFAQRSAEVKPRKISQDVLKQMGLDDREFFNPKSGKTFINTVRGDRFKKK